MTQELVGLTTGASRPSAVRVDSNLNQSLIIGGKEKSKGSEAFDKLSSSFQHHIAVVPVGIVIFLDPLGM